MKRSNIPMVVIMVGLITLFTATAAYAEPDITDRIQSRYESIQSFKGTFEQVLTNAATQESEKRSGDIWFKQPALVRWVTTKPEKEVLVIGKEIAWDYFEEDITAFKYSVEGLLNSKTILRFISGQANLRKDFTVKTKWIGDEEVRQQWGEGMTVLQLTPKEPEPGMVQAYIGVDPKSALLKRVLIVDFMGNGNDVTLNNLTFNENVPDSLFEFTPPEGVVIQDNTAGY